MIAVSTTESFLRETVSKLRNHVLSKLRNYKLLTFKKVKLSAIKLKSNILILKNKNVYFRLFVVVACSRIITYDKFWFCFARGGKSNSRVSNNFRFNFADNFRFIAISQSSLAIDLLQLN